jgi:heme/copper-type cytochrome/quinol oxidase subunit 1
MHFLGIAGMPRRIPGYDKSFWFFNHCGSIGHSLTTVSLLVFMLGIYNSQPTVVKLTEPDMEEYLEFYKRSLNQKIN